MGNVKLDSVVVTLPVFIPTMSGSNFGRVISYIV
jgi:hypothetical protein